MYQLRNNCSSTSLGEILLEEFTEKAESFLLFYTRKMDSCQLICGNYIKQKIIAAKQCKCRFISVAAGAEKQTVVALEG